MTLARGIDIHDSAISYRTLSVRNRSSCIGSTIVLIDILLVFPSSIINSYYLTLGILDPLLNFEQGSSTWIDGWWPGDSNFLFLSGLFLGIDATLVFLINPNGVVMQESRSALSKVDTGRLASLWIASTARIICRWDLLTGCFKLMVIGNVAKTWSRDLHRWVVLVEDMIVHTVVAKLAKSGPRPDWPFTSHADSRNTAAVAAD